MFSRWSIFGGGATNSRAPSHPTIENEVLAPLQAVGERKELLSVRVGHMIDRLEDLKSLSEDFQVLAKPFEDISCELPIAKARVLEVEALLEREITRAGDLSQEVREVSDRESALADEARNLRKRSTAQHELIEKLQSSATEDRLRLVELNRRLVIADQAVSVESENRLRLDAEVAALSKELSEAVEKLGQAEASGASVTEQLSELSKENRRQQDVIDSQVLKLVDHEMRGTEYEKRIQELQNELVVSLNRLETERADREKFDHRQEVAKSALQADNASLTLKVDALHARLESADHSLAHARQVANEKDVALRSAQSEINNSDKEIASLSRQLAQLTVTTSDARVQAEDRLRAYEEVSRRCEMLNKALSAKDAALDSANEKVRARSERLDDLTKKFAHEKAELTESQRKLVEELEHERADRMLAQGALKIARESRASLQRLNESLKRANRDMRPTSDDSGTAEPQPENSESSKAKIVSLASREISIT